VELNEEACDRYPYTPYNVPLFDGSMNTSGVATGGDVDGWHTLMATGALTIRPGCAKLYYELTIFKYELIGGTAVGRRSGRKR
jgi:hypothetical protein